MTAPSVYFTQHYPVEAPVVDLRAYRPFFKVKTRLDKLHADGVITWWQWRAGQRFCDIINAVRAANLQTRWLEPADHRGGADCGIIRKHDASEAYQVISRHLGDIGVALLVDAIVDDLKWSIIASKARVHPKTIRRRVLELIRNLVSIPHLEGGHR